MAEEKVCFVISPIGEKGSETYNRFLDVLDHVIRPAFQGSGIRVIRVDEIKKPGAFIRDVVQHIAGAHTVLADLTGQNANVFYELGVRHALSPRTILIAQDLKDVPSDLRGERMIIYDTSARGASTFREEIQAYLSVISQEPERPDNPVLQELARSVRDIPSELRQTFLARRANLGTKQQWLLRRLEKKCGEGQPTIEQGALTALYEEEYPEATKSEVFYRLEQLRLLGFIARDRTSAGSPFIYALSQGYRKEMGL